MGTVSTVGVTLVNTQADEAVASLQLQEGTTFQDLFTLHKVKLDNAHVTARLGGEEVDWDLEDELPDGVRVSVVPVNVKGA